MDDDEEQEQERDVSEGEQYVGSSDDVNPAASLPMSKNKSVINQSAQKRTDETPMQDQVSKRQLRYGMLHVKNFSNQIKEIEQLET